MERSSAVDAFSRRGFRHTPRPWTRPLGPHHTCIRSEVFGDAEPRHGAWRCLQRVGRPRRARALHTVGAPDAPDRRRMPYRAGAPKGSQRSAHYGPATGRAGAEGYVDGRHRSRNGPARPGTSVDRVDRFPQRVLDLRNPHVAEVDHGGCEGARVHGAPPAAAPRSHALPGSGPSAQRAAPAGPPVTPPCAPTTAPPHPRTPRPAAGHRARLLTQSVSPSESASRRRAVRTAGSAAAATAPSTAPTPTSASR